MPTYWRVPRPLLVHFTTADAWAAFEVSGDRWITSPSLGSEGFIHCSSPWQAPATVARHFVGRTDVVALALDPAGLRVSELRWDESYPGRFFPHHYAPIPRAAVVAAVPWWTPTDADLEAPGVLRLPPPWPAPPVVGALPSGASLRILTAGDVDAVAEVVERASTARRGAGSPTTVARAIDRLNDPDGWAVGVEIDTALRSLVLGVPMRADLGAGDVVPGWCHLGTVMTDPHWWGRRLAMRLLVESVHLMRVRGYTHAELWTQTDNQRALALYAGLDWQRSDRPSLVDDGESLVHHTLALRP